MQLMYPRSIHDPCTLYAMCNSIQLNWIQCKTALQNTIYNFFLRLAHLRRVFFVSTRNGGGGGGYVSGGFDGVEVRLWKCTNRNDLRLFCEEKKQYIRVSIKPRFNVRKNVFCKWQKLNIYFSKFRRQREAKYAVLFIYLLSILFSKDFILGLIFCSEITILHLNHTNILRY